MATSIEKGKVAALALAAAAGAFLVYVALAEASSPKTEANRDRCYAFLSDGRAWSSIPGDEQMRIVGVCNTFPNGLAFSEAN